MFKSNRLTKEQIKKHVDLVWANTTHANTPKYHVISEYTPTDDKNKFEARQHGEENMKQPKIPIPN